MKSQQPTEQSGVAPRPDELINEANLGELNANDRAASDPSYVITGEALRSLIDERINKKPKSWSHNPMLIGLVVVIATAVGGGLVSLPLTARYNRDLQKHSHLLELSKIRFQKVAEFAEQLDKNEVAFDDLFENLASADSDQDKNAKSKNIEEMQKIIHNERGLISQYRFWLGECQYQITNKYLEQWVVGALNQIVGRTGTPDLNEFKTLRENAKRDILQIRRRYFEGGETATNWTDCN